MCMLSPIVQEEKGCLTTFEEKKQKEVATCFGSQIILVVYIFDGIGLYKDCWSRASFWLPRTLHQGSLVWPQQTGWEILYSCRLGKKSVFVKMSVTFQSPPFL